MEACMSGDYAVLQSGPGNNGDEATCILDRLWIYILKYWIQWVPIFCWLCLDLNYVHFWSPVWVYSKFKIIKMHVAILDWFADILISFSICTLAIYKVQHIWAVTVCRKETGQQRCWRNNSNVWNLTNQKREKKLSNWKSKRAHRVEKVER